MNTFIRQSGRYIQRGTILDITKHIVVELAQQISFVRWNKKQFSCTHHS